MVKKGRWLRAGGPRAAGRRLAALLVLLGLTLPAVADDDVAVLLDRALAAETESLSLLLDHYRLEEDLLSPDVDRLVIFLTLSPGQAAAVEQLQLLVDGAQLNPKLALPKAAAQFSIPLFAQRIGAGNHRLRLDLRLSGGRGVLTRSLTLDKGNRARFVEFRLEGGRTPGLAASEW